MGKRVLLLVDVQNGFLPGGNLAVHGGDKILPVINRLMPLFEHVVLTQDWHPKGHLSFASSHPGKQVGDVISLSYGEQVLWPDHCVQGSDDAKISSELHADCAQLIIRKGHVPDVDSYSAFMEADRKTLTGLAGYLKEREVEHCYICGLATDFCVAWSAIDARSFGFKATVIEDACQGIDIHGSMQAARAAMTKAGVEFVTSNKISFLG